MIAGQLSEHFFRSEFACRCGCGFATVDAELVRCLEAIRWHFDRPVTVVSGCRCLAHNWRVGGKPESYHMKGEAADIQVADYRPDEVYSLIIALWPDVYGAGLYETFVHFDVRRTYWRG